MCGNEKSLTNLVINKLNSEPLKLHLSCEILPIANCVDFNFQINILLELIERTR